MQLLLMEAYEMLPMLCAVIKAIDLLLLAPRVGSGSCGFFVRIGPIRFLAGCRKRRLNQG